MENNSSDNLNITENHFYQEKPISIFLLDNDPIFRLGFQSIITSFPELELLDFDQSISIIKQIKEKNPQLLIIELEFLSITQKIINDFPNLPIFLLTSQIKAEKILAAKEIGIKGYAPKNIKTLELIKALHQVIRGENYWEQFRNLSTNNKVSKNWLSRLRQEGLQEINSNLVSINNQLNMVKSPLDNLFWSGRKRELLAAKWLINHLFPLEYIIIENQTEIPSANDYNSSSLVPINNFVDSNLFLSNDNLKEIFAELNIKLKSNLINDSNYILEIDILKEEKKQQLLQLILTKILSILENNQSTIDKQNLLEQNIIILKDIWQSVTISFFTNNYYQTIDLIQYAIIDILQKTEYPSNLQVVFQENNIFAQIIKYVIFKENIIIGTKIYNYASPEAREILVIILETLIIAIANSVMQVILNYFGEEEIIQEKLYKSEMLSLREIARFRNNLSLKYFRTKYFEEPKRIFEGQYLFLRIENSHIINKTIKQINRQEELKQLTGLRWAVTIILELRDALSPVVRSCIGWLGEGLVFILTQIIGRGIGLIGRGIFDGLGNSLPGNKYNKNNQK